ncbi:MAG: hypothetical protein AAFP26_14335 [Planctomycetota bacterium]
MIWHELNHCFLRRLMIDPAVGGAGYAIVNPLEDIWHLACEHGINTGLVPDHKVLGLDCVIRNELLDQFEAIDRAGVEGIELGNPPQRRERIEITPRLQLKQPKQNRRLGPVRLPGHGFFKHGG